MGFQAKGKLFKIFDAQQVTERFRKREFVVEMDDGGRYPQFVNFQVTGDRCESLDTFNVDDEVAIEFDLRGREWTSPKGEVRYFNSLEVWRIERAQAGAATETHQPAAHTASAGVPGPNPPPLTDDDVPF